MSKVSTIAYGSVKEYATVPTRLKEFREKNPRASIKSKPTHHEDGSLEFETVIVQDRADEYSAEANGHAFYTATEVQQKKAYEKLETISIGRALAKLGYLNNGQVATSEEMLEFEQYKDEKIASAIEAVSKATKRSEFEAIISNLNAEEQLQLAPHIKARTQELIDEGKQATTSRDVAQS